MYIVNNFCYGIDMNKDGMNGDFRDVLYYMDVVVSIPTGEYYKGIEVVFEIDERYHGGSTGNYYSGVVGFCLSDDDCNPNYISDIKDAKEEFFKKIWDSHLPSVILELEDDLKESEDFYKKEPSLSSKEKEEADSMLKSYKDFIEFLKTAEPEFYSVESSS